MKKQSSLLAILLFRVALAAAQISIAAPRVENRDNPLGIDVAPRFSWQLVSDRRNTVQTAYEIRVSTSALALTKGAPLLWTSGKVTSEASIWAPYGGPALQSGRKYWWQVRVWDNQGQASAWSAPAFWQMGLLQTSDWKAQWIEQGFPDDSMQASPMFRKTFVPRKKIASATAFITAHGLYEARINGERIGDAYLTPGWTAYRKRLQYQMYDVTAMLRKGENAVGVTLANGWYRGAIGWVGNRNFYGKNLALLFQLDIEYTDGSHDYVLSDGSWKSSTGPIRSAEIYHGEWYDARRQQPGWDRPGFDDGGWSGVHTLPFFGESLIATYNEPVRAHETFRPVRIFRTPKGELVADFGQNLVGWVRLRARGAAGHTITLKFAEVLDKQGNFYTDNLRQARVTDTWVLRGDGPEEFAPQFTFHGFRYAKIDNYPGELMADDITAVALYSDLRPTGQFTCSDSLINQLQHNIQWGQRGNFLDVPTDCPQRDERLGWTGDAQAFSRTAAFNMDVHNFFSKWLKDLAADQLPNGAVPWVIPSVFGGNTNSAAGWADASTIIPWNMYRLYGDRRLLEDQYPSMKAWVEYMRGQSKNDLWNTGAHFGDWLFYSVNNDCDGRSAVTDKYLIAQCFYIHSTQLLINAARELGKTDDVATYSALLEKIKQAYWNEYVTPNGRLVSPTQTAYVLALQFDLLPAEKREQAVQFLVNNIHAYNNHLTTGFLGTPYLCHVLTRYGQNDLAYTLLNQKTYPSWLYPVTMGATTIWERWDGIRPDSSFEEASMNSFNHYAYGAIGDWLYRNVAGINLADDATAYKTIVIHPRPGGGLSQAEATLMSPYGPIRSGWKMEENRLSMEVDIPANTRATIFIPASNLENVLENGRPLTQSPGLELSGMQEGCVVVKAGSGRYRFTVRT